MEDSPTPPLRVACASRECPTPYNPDRKMKFCARCRMVRYCSQECQRAHWSEHKSMCRAFTTDPRTKIDIDAQFLMKHKDEILERLASGRQTHPNEQGLLFVTDVGTIMKTTPPALAK